MTARSQASPWLTRSLFSKASERAMAVEAELERLLGDASDPGLRLPSFDETTQAVVDGLTAPLRTEPPTASQAAEAAFTIAAFCIAENRVLNVIDSSVGDVVADGQGTSGRLASDRAVSDKLCSRLLAPRNIPATKGPFQSSTFRAGYLAGHARSAALSDYARWQSASGRTLSEVIAVAQALAGAFMSAASILPPWPTINASALTFTKFRLVRDDLLSTGSGGAFEQYLLAGLLEQEIGARFPGHRVDTKNVGATDRSSGSIGDIQIRHHQALVGAIEVTAAAWDSKLGQLEAAARAGLREITVAAGGVRDAAGQEIADAIDPVAARLGIDPSVIDLLSFMDVIASRITPHDRAAALTSTYRRLAQFHSREPALVNRLIESLYAHDVIATSTPEAIDNPPEDVLEEIVERIRTQLLRVGSIDLFADTLRDFAEAIDAADAGSGTSPDPQ